MKMKTKRTKLIIDNKLINTSPLLRTMKIVFSKCHRLGEGEDSVGEICMETIKQSVQTQVIPSTASDRVRPFHHTSLKKI